MSFPDRYSYHFYPVGAVLRLPGLFDSCAITTNFDRVLEQAETLADAWSSGGVG